MTDSQTDSWFVYMVRCSDNTLYTGIAKNVEKRIREHNSEKGGARYTRARRPVTLVYTETASSRSEAAKREWNIKRLGLAKKMALIEQR